MRISRSLAKQDHSVRLDVTNRSSGWHVRRDEDAQTTRSVNYDDWHRVERAIADFDRTASALREQGWHDDGDRRGERRQG